MNSKKEQLFAIASDNYQNEVLGLNKYGSFKTNRRVIIKLNLEFGYKKVKDITKQDVQRYVAKLNGNVGIDYIRHHLSLFKNIMEYADDDWSMPRVRIPKRTSKPRQEYYTFEEVRKLIQKSNGLERGLIMLLAETGCRIGEALALQTKDIGLDEINITKNMYEGVQQPTPKTEASIRKVKITDKLRKELKFLTLDKPNAYVFRSSTGRAAWPQQLMISFKDIAARAGVEYKSFHAFRRGNITECCNSIGIPERIVGYRVGHESAGMTLGVYAQTPTGCDAPWIEKISEHLYLTNDKESDRIKK